MKGKSFVKKAVSLTAAVTIASAVSVSAGGNAAILGYMGDINHDMEVNVADLVALSQHLLGRSAIDEGAVYNADMNFDGIVDVFDLVILRQYVAGSRQLDPITDGEGDTTTSATSSSTETTVTTTVSATESTSRTRPTETTTSTTASTIDTETTTTTVTVVTDGSFIEPPIEQVKAYLPSQGEANLVIFYIDFPDCQYSYAPSEEEIEEIAFGSEDTSDSNYPFDSMSAFYNRSSKGVMNLKGKVFRYTTKNNQSYYNENKFLITQECYEAFKDSVDFAQFDGDGDGYIDATLLTVPNAAGDDYWWPCAGPVDQDNYYVDGVRIGHIITGNAQIESSTNYKNFNSSYLHEMGHCMGLPDYYLFTSNDSEGMHGTAGFELMDTDASTDFSAVSKIQLGWYTESQIQVYDKSLGSQTFTLTNAQTNDGNCVIIPSDNYNGYNSEYFVVEFATNRYNNSNPEWWVQTGSGVRVYHVEGTLQNYGTWTGYKYASGSEYTNSDKGRRFIRIIDDTETDNFYRAGDVVSNSISGFNWYDNSGNQSIDPGVTITVGENSGDTYTITIANK